ncbi:MAG: DUF58 domain-containing protein [Myxococcales bacterium]|nr:DUF58 domain-containing protein [Myxococcales bacterium]
MLPLPSRAAIWLFVGLSAGLAAAVALEAPAAVGLAGAGLVGIVTALAATLPAGRRLRRQRLEFAWWIDQGTGVASGSVVPGAPFEVRCFLRHRGSDDLYVAALEPIVAPGVDVETTPAFVVPARSRTELRLRLCAPAIGRIVLHGLAVRLRGPFGLFETPLYFPNPLVIRVLPRAAARRGGGAARAHGAAMESSGRTRARRRGGGTELHELRELVPGDPFKSIAWKASARRGRLLVREVEQEIRQTRWIVLDVSGTMRGGVPGRRKLDFALEAAAAAARGALAEGDRVGLLGVDTRVVAQLAPGEGRAHELRVYEALLAMTELVDEDLTDIDEDGLCERVGRYVRQQDGLDFRRRGVFDVPGLVAHCRAALDRAAALTPGHGAREVRAGTSTGRVLRAFCRERGLALPHQIEPSDRAKSGALAQALRTSGGASREPGAILVITDFDGVVDLEPVVASLRLALSHGNRVAFLLPDGRAFAPPPESDAEATLARIYGRAEARRLDDARRTLVRLGATAWVVGEGMPAAVAVERAENPRRAA